MNFTKVKSLNGSYMSIRLSVLINMLSTEFHRGGIFSRGSTGIPPHLDHTPWYCPPEGGVWIPLVVVLQVEYSTKKLPRQSTGKTTKIPLVLRLQETNSCVRAIQSRLVVRTADTTKKWQPTMVSSESAAAQPQQDEREEATVHNGSFKSYSIQVCKEIV
jgi:hypothetical protein